MLQNSLIVALLVFGRIVDCHKWASNHDAQNRNWNPSRTLQQQRQQPPPVFLTSTHQPSDLSRFKGSDSQQRQQQKKDDSDNDSQPGNDIIGNGRSFDGSKGGNDISLTPSSMSGDHHQQQGYRPYNFNSYYNVHRFDPSYSSYPGFPKFGPGYRKDKYGHGYGYSCKQGDDCDKVKESVNQIPTMPPHSLSSHRPFQTFMPEGFYPSDPTGYHAPYPSYKGHNYPDGRFHEIGSPYPSRYLHDQQQPPSYSQFHSQQNQQRKYPYLQQQQHHHHQEQQQHRQQQQNTQQDRQEQQKVLKN